MYFKARLAAAGLIAVTVASAAFARPGGWGDPWNSPGRIDRPFGDRSGPDDREGKVDAESFVAPGAAAAALGKGRVAVRLEPQAPPPDEAGQEFRLLQDSAPTVSGAPFEAAVIDQMVRAGYDTSGAAGTEDQVVELSVARTVLVPPEARRNPVSGTMEMGISNRGTMVGGAINLDFTKPKKALVSTRLDARIRDKASGALLWEGHADIATRDGADGWGDQAIAAKLAQELFKPFPGSSDKPVR